VGERKESQVGKGAVTRFPVLYGADETVQEVADRLHQQGLQISGRFSGQIVAIQVQERAVIRWGNARPTMAERLAAALQYLGTNRLGSIGYKFNPRHSNNPDIYMPARTAYIAEIEAAAARDRSSNPAFIRAQAVAAAGSAA
jgi:hypothetical protein